MKSQDTASVFPEGEQIYTKKINQTISIELFRKLNLETEVFELKIITPGKTSVKKFMIEDKDIKNRFPFGIRTGYQDKFNIINVLYNSTSNELFIIFDKFGQVDIHKIDFEKDYSVKNEKIIHIKTYQIVPRDTQLLGEDFQDEILYKNTVHLLAVSMYSNWGLYYFYSVNTANSMVKENILNIAKFEDSAIIIESNIDLSILTIHELGSALRTIIQESIYKNEQFRYLYSIRDRGLKECGHGTQYFFVEINDKPKLMIYEGGKKYYIGDYETHSYDSIPKNDIDKIIHSFNK